MVKGVLRIELDGFPEAGDGLVQPALVIQRLAQRGSDPKQRRVELSGLLELGNSLVKLTLLLQFAAQVGVGLGEIRVEFDGLAEACDGLVQPALDFQHQAQFAVGHGEIRGKLYGLFQAFAGLVQLALASLHSGEVYPDGMILGPQGAGRVEGSDPQAVLGPDVLQAEDEGQFEVGRVLVASSRQPRYRVQPLALHQFS